MRKTVLSLLAIALLASCGNNNSSKSATTTNTTASSSGMTDEQAKGLDLITKSDCLGCHKIADKLVGPAYIDVAKRYAGQPGIEDTLVQKIIKGGSGHWGNVPMQAHPALSTDDAKKMVAYILSTPNQ